MLNENEINVLKELFRSSKENGHDFGFIDDVQYKLIGLKKDQIPGYISQLSQKGYIYVYSDERYYQFELTNKFWNEKFEWARKSNTNLFYCGRCWDYHNKINGCPLDEG